MTEQNEEQRVLASFGIKRFNTEKFENTDYDSVLVCSPLESKGIDSAMSAFYNAVSIEDALPIGEEE